MSSRLDFDPKNVESWHEIEPTQSGLPPAVVVTFKDRSTRTYEGNAALDVLAVMRDQNPPGIS